jgi:DNA-binding CsgD family transcriptional regulator
MLSERTVYQAFGNIFERAVRPCARAKERSEGVAFLRAAKELYGISGVLYLCINIPVYGRATFAHCLYSDRAVTHALGSKCSDPVLLAELRALVGSEEQGCSELGIVLPLAQQQDEIATLGLALNVPVPDEQKQNLLRELRVLGHYFHSHNLRINGHDCSKEIIMSARELDCLKWAAAGKTAWEASVILGISERTVRFHLNTAREKLGCSTTTHAVAKAIANHIIQI